MSANPVFVLHHTETPGFTLHSYILEMYISISFYLGWNMVSGDRHSRSLGNRTQLQREGSGLEENGGQESSLQWGWGASCLDLGAIPLEVFSESAGVPRAVRTEISGYQGRAEGQHGLGVMVPSHSLLLYSKEDHTQCSVSDGWRKRTVGRTRLWTPWSISWQSWPVGQVWSTLLCISSGRIPSCGAGYHQWDHFCIHPKLLIRGSWIFKYLSSLICLTISILSLGLFCGFSLLHICSVIHASSSDVTDFEMIPAIPGSPKGWVFSLPWLPAFPCSFWFQRWVGGGTACRVPLWELASAFCKFLLIIIIQHICLSPQILQKDFISSC